MYSGTKNKVFIPVAIAVDFIVLLVAAFLVKNGLK